MIVMAKALITTLGGANRLRIGMVTYKRSREDYLNAKKTATIILPDEHQISQA